MKRFYIHKLGCPKNDVDADYIAGFLIQKKLTPVDSPEEADLLIVNTCGFIQPAKEESIEAILGLARLKGKYGGKKLIVTGCLAQRYADDLSREIPEADGIFGLNDFFDIERLIDEPGERVISRRQMPLTYPDFNFSRVIQPDEQFAYLKISDGCDNRCSYCAIPDIRGHFRSRPPEGVIDEARYLLESGKKELVLVSQESTAYGRDLPGKPPLVALLDRLSALPGDFWIRLMYMHPARLTEELIDYMIDNPRICNYFDMPLQHIDNDLLGAMKRPVTQKRIETLLEYIRSRRDRSAIRTNFIVGFPGETERQFEDLCRFIEKQRFDRLGAFAYSAEENTPAADMPNQVAEDVREWRYHRLMEIQQGIALENNEAEVGRIMDVLVEEVDMRAGRSTGRTRFDAPEIDQTVRLDFTDVPPGAIIPVIITGYDGYDLLGGRRDL